MNIITFSGIIYIVILLIMLGTKSIKKWGLYVTGIPLLAAGFYLSGASMWRTIALVAFIIGVVIELVAVILTICQKRKKF